jgi:hypothetical protein
MTINNLQIPDTEDTKELAEKSFNSKTEPFGKRNRLPLEVTELRILFVFSASMDRFLAGNG